MFNQDLKLVLQALVLEPFEHVAETGAIGILDCDGYGVCQVEEYVTVFGVRTRSEDAQGVCARVTLGTGERLLDIFCQFLSVLYALLSAFD